MSLTEAMPPIVRVVRHDGLKVTMMVQDWPAPTLDPQVFHSEKVGLGVEAIPVMLSAVLPVLVSVVVNVRE